MSNNNSAVLYIQGLPSKVKADFKAAAARKGKTMREVIIEFMAAYAKVKLRQ